jgi:hypothetical protein
MARFCTVRRKGLTQGLGLQYIRHHNQCCLPSNTSGELKVWLGKAFLNTCAELKDLVDKMLALTSRGCWLCIDTNYELKVCLPKTPATKSRFCLVSFTWTSAIHLDISDELRIFFGFVPFHDSDEFKVRLGTAPYPAKAELQCSKWQSLV